MRCLLLQNLLLWAVLSVLFSACGRSDLMRIRVLAPVTETKKDFTLLSNNQTTNSSKETLEVPTTSGSSLYLVFGTLGLGSTSVSTKIEKEARSKINDTLILKETTILTGSFNDLAFVLGENYTIMWGYGIFGSGSLKVKAEYGYSGAMDETLESSSLVGNSTFIVLGHHGSSFETLLGMRINKYAAELDSTGTSAKTLHSAGSIVMIDKDIYIGTTQVQLGIGFTF